ncbi:hypothetical protein N9954_05525 [Maribacter sp.]|nr:hypothetical protein [Maribacter sp.]
MKFKNLVLLVFSVAYTQVNAQEEVHSFEFKKGEVLDVMLLKQSKADDAKELFETYKTSAFPVAFEYSYQPLSGFGISKLTLGTNNADAFLFGKWGSFQKREAFLKVIADRVPDFHQQRRVLFPDFRLTYYEVKSDLKFSIDKAKYTTVTALWAKPGSKEEASLKRWKAEVLESGGTFVITLKDGKSPLGYYYNPDILHIVQWENEAAFQRFAQEHPIDSYRDFRNVHQFVI